MSPNLITYVKRNLDQKGLRDLPNLEAFGLSSLAEKILALYLSRIGKSFEEWIGEYISSQCDSFIATLENEIKSTNEATKKVEVVVKTIPASRVDTISLSPGATGALVVLINQIIAELRKRKGRDLLDGISVYVGRNHRISTKQLRIIADFIAKVNLRNRTALDLLMSMGVDIS